MDTIASAELVAEFEEPVLAGLGRVQGGGWTLRDAEGRVLLVGEDFRVKGRFAVPERFRRAFDYDWEVSSDGRWAVFSGLRHTACVDADGRVVWETDHPARLSLDGDPEVACARFR